MRCVLFAFVSSAVALRDVPLGECYECEVTCFEDCALKYDREVIQPDNFMQLAVEPKTENRTASLTSKYGDCLKDDKCPCRATPAGKKLALADKKKKAQCAVGAVPCSSKCAEKVVDEDIKSMSGKTGLLQKKKDFPLHSVKINVFAKGKMTLDHCLKYCLASTCGCSDAPGFNSADDLKAAAKANGAVNGVTDTPKSPQYRPAKIEECGKGMLGKKVASGLYIKLEGGPGGNYEVCSKTFLDKVGASDKAAKCKSGASDDAKYGCLWDAEKNKCVVGFSPILTCNVQYYDDPTL